jgi:hypothetical protein
MRERLKTMAGISGGIDIVQPGEAAPLRLTSPTAIAMPRIPVLIARRVGAEGGTETARRPTR